MEKQLQTIRNKIIDTTWFGSVFFVIPAVFASISRSFQTGWLWAYTAHLCFMVMVIAIYLFRSKLPVNLKGHLLSTFLVLLSFVGTIQFGISGGHYISILSVTLITLIFGKRYSLIYIIVSLIGISVISYLHFNQLIKPGQSLDFLNGIFTSWIMVIATILWQMIIIIYSIGLFYNYFTQNIQSHIQKNEIQLVLQNELIKAKEKAEENDRLKTSFLRNISHEIRTPLNAIVGFSGILNNDDLSDDKRDSFIEIIINNSNQLLAVINDILTLSKIEAKQEEVKNDFICLNKIISDLVLMYKQQALDLNITLTTKFQLNEYQSYIYIDKTKIIQILTYLISNALKFTPEGFIEVGYNFKNQFIEFFIKDSGIGIEPGLQGKIFDRFRQVEHSLSRNYGGIGLGLTISKAYVELLGGKIWLESEPDKGSTFYFTIPLKLINKEVLIDELPNNQRIKLNRQKTVLIAEDDEYNFMYLSELMINLDINIIRAKNGKDAIEKTLNNLGIDLILMDINMPVLDGYDAISEIKKYRKHVPIIVQTAYSLATDKEQAMHMGCIDYISKPIESKIFIDMIRKYLNDD